MLLGLAARFFAGTLGFLLLGWVSVSVPALQLQAGMRNLTLGLMRDDDYTADNLQDLVQSVDGHQPFIPCAELLRSVGFVRFQQVKLKGETVDQQARNESMDVAITAARQALHAAPIQSYMWLTLVTLELARRNDSSGAVSALNMSYQTGAHEDWIAVRRAEIGFLLFPLLDQDVRAKLVTEFQDLANEIDLIPVVAKILIGTGAKYRDDLLKTVGNAPEENRKLLSNYLFQLGVDSQVPGLPPRGARPWE